MFALIHEQMNEIGRTIHMLHGKKSIALNHMSYMRALQLFYITLKKTNHELNDIYFTYALKPQIKVTQPIVVYCLWCMHHIVNKQGHTACSNPDNSSMSSVLTL